MVSVMPPHSIPGSRAANLKGGRYESQLTNLQATLDAPVGQRWPVASSLGVPFLSNSQVVPVQSLGTP